VTEGRLSVGEASFRLSLPKSTLENWMRAAKRGKFGEIGKSHRPLTELEVELAQVMRELAIVKMERDIPKKSGRVLCERVAAQYAMIDRMRLLFSVSLLCRVFGVSPSGYHAWHRRPPSRRLREDARLEVEIRAAHRRTRESYGSERLQRDLADHGAAVGVHRVRRLRKKLGLRCKQKRRFQAPTDSRHTLPVAENLLGQRFQASAPSQIWLTDIAYTPTDEGWQYPAGHKDLYIRKIGGCAVGPRMTKNLIYQSLFRAAATRTFAALAISAMSWRSSISSSVSSTPSSQGLLVAGVGRGLGHSPKPVL
jgi:putative transposase